MYRIIFLSTLIIMLVGCNNKDPNIELYLEDYNAYITELEMNIDKVAVVLEDLKDKKITLPQAQEKINDLNEEIEYNFYDYRNLPIPVKDNIIKHNKLTEEISNDTIERIDKIKEDLDKQKTPESFTVNSNLFQQMEDIKIR